MSGLGKGKFDLVPMLPDLRCGRYDSVTDFQRSAITGRFSISRGNIGSKGSCRWDSHRYWTKDRLSGTYHSTMPFRAGLRWRLDAIFSRAEIPGLKSDLVSVRYDINRLLRSKYSGWYVVFARCDLRFFAWSFSSESSSGASVEVKASFTPS